MLSSESRSDARSDAVAVAHAMSCGLPASPGPGAYAPAIGKMPKVSASSHVFLSNVHRLGTKSKRVKPPGPGAWPWPVTGTNT